MKVSSNFSSIEIITDTLFRNGDRHTTVRGEMGYNDHAEARAHKFASWSFGSLRAIRTASLIEQARTRPWQPPVWREAGKAMAPSTPLTGWRAETMTSLHRAAARKAADIAEDMLHFGADRTHANKLLSPFVRVPFVMTFVHGDGLQNFLGLRTEGPNVGDAIRDVAQNLAVALYENPKSPSDDWLHLPFIEPGPATADLSTLIKASAARCARTSVALAGAAATIESDAHWADERLLKPGHAVPFEHPRVVADGFIVNGRGYFGIPLRSYDHDAKRPMFMPYEGFKVEP